MDSIENDPRFAHISTDPRFRPMPKSKRKVKIDSRFQSLFTNTHFSHRTDIDKRGRPILDSSKKNKHVMERFYELSDNSDDSEHDEAENEDTPKEPAPKKLKKDTRGGKVVSPKKDAKPESDDKPEESERETSGEDKPEESESSGESEDDETELPEFTQEFAIEETEIDHKWNELHTDAPAVSESTHRLAVCNMDWDYVKAQDLFILFKSFVPEGGRVKSVTIYPSEFGKERMAEEALLGPREIRDGVKEESVRDDEVKGRKRKKKQVKDQKKIKQTEKEREAAQTEKLREYQLNRLRYYFAVVDCDSVGTADVIYSECDGREYQLSSVRLDLRFIPDDMTFDDEPKESFSDEQSVVGYQPSQFNSTALSQAKVEVTWDETEFDRLSRRIGSMQPKELESIVEENKFAEIIAPPESDSEEEDGRPAWLQNILSDEKKTLTEEEKIQVYRKVLMDQLAEDEDVKKGEEGEVDQEVEWQVGLKTSVEKKLKKKELQGENSIVSEFLEKKKAKKKKKRAEKLKKLEVVKDDGDNEAFSDDEIPGGIESVKEMFNEESDLSSHVKGKKKKEKLKKRKGDKVEENGIDEKLKAELELIVMDEEGDKKISKPEVVKEKSKKKKKKLAKMKKSVDEEDYNLDLNDPRFSALYDSHLFHIDPTAPQFKKTKNMMKLVDEQIKRKKQTLPKTTNTSVIKNESQAIVERLKSKIKK